MSRLVAVLATVACMIGLAVAPAPPAAADSVNVGESGWSVALTIPDHRWTSESCQFVPVTAVVSGAMIESWTFGGFVAERGEYSEGSTWYIDYDTKVTQGTGAFTFRHAVMLCPGMDRIATYDVVGEVGVLPTGSTQWSWRPYRLSFSVLGIPTTTSLESITLEGTEVAFAGRVVAVAPVQGSFRSCQGAGVRIEYATDGDWEWAGYAELQEDGSFLATVPPHQLVGSRYRATMDEGSICATSSSAARALPFRLPTVRLSSVSKGSKLKVDIDPNMGRKAWVFQVQRRAGDDSWTTLGTYRTRGNRETRTINLRKGEYRVVVRPRFGFVATYSDSVSLKK